AYAASCLEQLLESAQQVVRKAWDDVAAAHGMRTLFLNEGEENEDWLDVHIWLKGITLRESANELLYQMAISSTSDADEPIAVQVKEDVYSDARQVLEALNLDDAANELNEVWTTKSSGELMTIFLRSPYATAIQDIFEALNRHHDRKYGEEDGEIVYDIALTQVKEDVFGAAHAILTALDLSDAAEELAQRYGETQPGEFMPTQLLSPYASAVQDILEAFNDHHDMKAREKGERGEADWKQDNGGVDIASLALCYRLARNVEAALAMCAAMEVIGEPVRQLLWAVEDPGSPAIVLEMRQSVEAV
ncbi:MAG: hypothetical protein OXI73_14840, partial [Rhodospirillales bacterium]|nr:hypothetical protein [Rhodospirillales bacterium]